MDQQFKLLQEKKKKQKVKNKMYFLPHTKTNI